MKQKRNSKKQDRIIDAISAIVLSMAVFIIVANIATGGQEGAKEDAAPVVAVGEPDTSGRVAGVDLNLIAEAESDKTATEGEGGESTEENVTTEQSTTEPAAYQVVEVETTPAAEISSKEYDNVTSGRLAETAYVKDDYFQDTLFLGDSRTVALQTNGFIKAQNTFAVNGISHVTYLTQQFWDPVTEISADIFTIVSMRRPERIYVALGINGVAFINRDEFLNKYNELIDRLMSASPESKIIIQCILPVNENTYTGGNQNLNNAVIDSMNAELLSMAESKGIFYLDISGMMKGGNNGLLPQYDSGDGLHFSFTGYSVVYDGICRHGVD